MKINTNFSSPNYSKRTKCINYIILHYTEMDFSDALHKLCDQDESVSAHYLIKEDGKIFQLVEDDNVAWHAGESFWKGQESLNQNSIGIELDNLGDHDFSKKQMDSCIRLCKTLQSKYNIPPENIIGHSDVAPSRKIDPGIFFDWSLMAKNGLGTFRDLHFNRSENVKIFSFGDYGENVKILQKKLAKIGYKITENGKFDLEMNYVIRAFQSKFYPERIKNYSIDFYNNPTSQYYWCRFSDKLLNSMLDLY